VTTLCSLREGEDVVDGRVVGSSCRWIGIYIKQRSTITIKFYANARLEYTRAMIKSYRAMVGGHFTWSRFDIIREDSSQD